MCHVPSTLDHIKLSPYSPGTYNSVPEEFTDRYKWHEFPKATLWPQIEGRNPPADKAQGGSLEKAACS